MILSHIAAAAENDVIGVDGRLPWDIPEDMKFFKDKTRGHMIIMGRKTYESMGRPLPDRLNVIITRQSGFSVAGGVVVPSLEAAIEHCQGQTAKWGDEVFIIGGGEIYRQSMSLTERIYLTRIHQVYPGDACYPKVDPRVFDQTDRRDCAGDPAYTFFVYQRRQS